MDHVAFVGALGSGFRVLGFRGLVLKRQTFACSHFLLVLPCLITCYSRCRCLVLAAIECLNFVVKSRFQVRTLDFALLNLNPKPLNP